MSFFQGEPKTGEAPSEQYLYDAGGLRLVRLALGRDGKARISVRDVSGQVAAEYIDEPGSEGMSLEREFVYGFGRLLVERQPSAGTPTQSASSSLYSTGSYSLDLTDGAGGTSFDVDIQTESGFRNQVRSVSVSRVGENLLVRWSLHQDNGKAFQIYFHRADNGLTYVLSATALPSGTTEYTIASQALAAPCGGIFLRQGEMGTGGSLTNPTDPSPEAGLPGPFYGELEPGAGGCLGGSDPPAPRRLVDRYHFRDHLGSLRIETGEAGWLDLGFDYYPFGLQMESDYAESFDESRRKYTGHERDSETGQDYMMARYKGIQLADFMTPDPIAAGPGSAPSAWNKYSYVSNPPIALIDPLGLAPHPNPNCSGLLGCPGSGGTDPALSLMDAFDLQNFPWMKSGLTSFGYDPWAGLLAQGEGGSGGGSYPGPILDPGRPPWPSEPGYVPVTPPTIIGPPAGLSRNPFQIGGPQFYDAVRGDDVLSVDRWTEDGWDYTREVSRVTRDGLRSRDVIEYANTLFIKLPTMIVIGTVGGEAIILAFGLEDASAIATAVASEYAVGAGAATVSLVKKRHRLLPGDIVIQTFRTRQAWCGRQDSPCLDVYETTVVIHMAR